MLLEGSAIFFAKHLSLCSFWIVQLSFHPTRLPFPKTAYLSFHKFLQTLIGLWHVWFSVKALFFFFFFFFFFFLRYRALLMVSLLTLIPAPSRSVLISEQVMKGLFAHFCWSTLKYDHLFFCLPFLGRFTVLLPYYFLIFPTVLSARFISLLIFL